MIGGSIITRGLGSNYLVTRGYGTIYETVRAEVIRLISHIDRELRLISRVGGQCP